MARVALTCPRLPPGGSWGVTFQGWPDGDQVGFRFHARASEGLCGSCGKVADRVVVDGETWARCPDGWRGLVFRVVDGEVRYHQVAAGSCAVPV